MHGYGIIDNLISKLKSLRISNNGDGKTISEIGGFKADDVTKISFQYDNPAVKGRTVEDREEINKLVKNKLSLQKSDDFIKSIF